MTSPIRPMPAINGSDSEPQPVSSDTTRIRILLVDDDELFRESLAMNLADEEFQVTECVNGQACLDVLGDNAAFDLILLDWRMPGLSGLEVMQQIKSAGIDIPVVFLTAFTTERNEAAALDCGATDFLDKSRSAAVLARRIRILVGSGRNPMQDAAGLTDILRLGPLDIHFRINRANWDGQPVPLTTTEFRVVQLLASRAGEDVSYRAIYDVVHGRGFIAGDGSDGYRTNVRSMIKRIRQKFREVDDNFEEIENYPGFGYRWRPADEATPMADRTDRGYDATYPMPGRAPLPGRVPAPERPMHHGANGQIPTRVVDAISQLPFVRSVTTWRRRTDPETDLDPAMHLAQVLGQVNPKATVTTTFSAFSREKVPVMSGHNPITDARRDDTG